MPFSGKLPGGWAARKRRTSSAKACSSAEKPKSMRLLRFVRQRHERVAAKRVEDDALHVLEGFRRARLEPQGEVRIGIGGAHEPPAFGKEDPGAVDGDGLVAPCELAPEL